MKSILKMFGFTKSRSENKKTFIFIEIDPNNKMNVKYSENISKAAIISIISKYYIEEINPILKTKWEEKQNNLAANIIVEDLINSTKGIKFSKN